MKVVSHPSGQASRVCSTVAPQSSGVRLIYKLNCVCLLYLYDSHTVTSRNQGNSAALNWRFVGSEMSILCSMWHM